MDVRIKPLLLISVILLTAAAGIILKYFGLDTYAIILGFRFHLGCILPFLILIRKIPSDRIKLYFKSPEYKKNFIPMTWILIPILITAALYLSGILELGDPEYFYEFGLSSIVDYPVYLIWNLLHFFAFFILLKEAEYTFSKRLIPVSFSILFLFVYEIFNTEPLQFHINSSIVLAMLSLCGALLIKYFSNIYWFTITLFTFLWTSLLLFGTGSEAAVNILFASSYESWEGFFNAGKVYSEYIIPLYTAIFFLLLLISSLFQRKKLTHYH